MNKQMKRLPDKSTRNNSRVAGMFFFITMVLIFGVLGGRFLYVASFKEVKDHDLSTAARKIYMQTQVINAKRGNIYDANGMLLAENTSTYSIYAVLDRKQKTVTGAPMHVVDKEHTASVLAKYLPLSKTKILAILNPNNPGLFQVEFGNAGANISIETHNKIVSENLPGIEFTKQPARLYPNGMFASHLIGITNTNTNPKTGAITLTGVMGIEKELNKLLAGKNGIKEVKSTPSYTIDDKTKGDPVQDGDQVYTTIDSKLQTLLESEMTTLNTQTTPVNATATVVDARTGAIVATTQRPTFDATTRAGIGKLWQNLLVEDSFEPGSTMKVFSLAAAIDSGNWHPNQLYQSGTYLINGQKVTDWDSHGWGMIPYVQGFARSSNVAMAHVEQTMGPALWHKYIDAFHFNRSTNSGLANESAGGMQFKYPIEQANTAFGQGIRVTPMQMLQAFTAIAGNGQELKPYFISKIVNPNTDKVIYRGKRTVIGRPIKESTAVAARKVMQNVIYQPYGTGISYKIPGFRVAGKTGTAQIATSHGYSVGDENVIHSFVGMVPADKPKYIMYITLNQPKKIPGPLTKLMANVFIPVMEQALKMDESHETQTAIATIPTVTGTDVTKAQASLKHEKFNPVVVGSGDTVTQQFPAAQTQQLNNQRVFIKTSGQISMPDMVGWSKNDVLIFATMANIDVDFEGSGFVKNQSIKPGTILQNNQQCTVQLK